MLHTVSTFDSCLFRKWRVAQGVRDINFSNDGRRFLSSGYDRVVKLWDTETGQVIKSLGEGKMFFTAKFHPNDDKQNVCMAGCQDKKCYQWDMNTGDLVQARPLCYPLGCLIVLRARLECRC